MKKTLTLVSALVTIVTLSAHAADPTWSNLTLTGTLNVVTLRINGHATAVIVAPPVAATSSGEPGQVATDGSYFYFCTGTNTWRRAAISSW